MDSLKDLVAFLKTQSNGASMGELKEIFSNEVELKQFIKSGLDINSIFKDGEKRGTRYYAIGMSVTQKNNEKQKKDKKDSSKEDDSYENTLEHKDLDNYLNSDKPINGMGVFSKIIKFGEKDKNNFNKFLSSGSVLKQNFVMHDKNDKKNKIIEVHEHKQYNKISLRREGRRFIVIFYGIDKHEEEEFVNYEEFREFLRSKLI